MLVCHCHVVYADTVEAEIAAGAASPEELAQRCGAGATCGGCHGTLEDLLERLDAAVERALQAV